MSIQITLRRTWAISGAFASLIGKKNMTDINIMLHIIPF
jgi:hypothetical protein